MPSVFLVRKNCTEKISKSHFAFDCDCINIVAILNMHEVIIPVVEKAPAVQ